MCTVWHVKYILCIFICIKHASWLKESTQHTHVQTHRHTHTRYSPPAIWATYTHRCAQTQSAFNTKISEQTLKKKSLNGIVLLSMLISGLWLHTFIDSASYGSHCCHCHNQEWLKKTRLLKAESHGAANSTEVWGLKRQTHACSLRGVGDERGFSQVYLDRIIQCLCVVSSEAQMYIQTNKRSRARIREALTVHPLNSVNINPHIWQCRFEKLWDWEDLQTSNAFQSRILFTQQPRLSAHDSKPVKKSVPESETWISGTGGLICLNPGRAWRSSPLLWLPKTSQLVSFSASFMFLWPIW